MPFDVKVLQEIQKERTEKLFDTEGRKILKLWEFCTTKNIAILMSYSYSYIEVCDNNMDKCIIYDNLAFFSDIAMYLYKGMDLEISMIESEIYDIQKTRMDLAVAKNTDYASVIDVIEKIGEPGIRSRLMDKIARLLSLTSKNIIIGEVKNESILDTFTDIANYCDYAIALLKGKW